MTRPRWLWRRSVDDEPKLRVIRSEVLRRWHGVVAVENTMTRDGRLITSGAITWPELPRPVEDARNGHRDDHNIARIVGRVEEVRRAGHAIIASGITILPPGTYPAGCCLGPDMATGTDGDTLTVSAGALWSVALYDEPSWATTYVTVTDEPW